MYPTPEELTPEGQEKDHGQMKVIGWCFIAAIALAGLVIFISTQCDCTPSITR